MRDHLVAATATRVEHGRPQGGLVAGVKHESGQRLPHVDWDVAVSAANGGAIGLGN